VVDPPPGNFADLDERGGYTRLWARGIRGQGVVVAVLDTGLDATGVLAGAVVVARDFTGEGSQPADRGVLHGTRIARLVRLVAPKATIADLKVLPSRSRARRKHVIEALHYCIQERASLRVATLALSFPRGLRSHKPDRCDLCRAVTQAVEAGIHVIAAAGNEGPRLGTVTCPATAEGAFTVGASGTREQLEWWDAIPPLKLWLLRQSGWLDEQLGTSFSAAYVAGGVALVLSAAPDLSPRRLKECHEKVGRLIRGAEAQGIRQTNWEDHLACVLGPESLETRYPWPLKTRLPFSEAVDRLYRLAADESTIQVIAVEYLTDALDIALIAYENLVHTHPLARTELEYLLSRIDLRPLPAYERRFRELGALG
jgi:hypothetical protein